MKHMIGLGLAVVAMAAHSPVFAQGDICAEVREVIAAARETPPFASYPHNPNWENGRRMFGFIDCGYTNHPGEGARFRCGMPDSGKRFSGDVLMSRIAQCLPRPVRSGPEYRAAQGTRPGPLIPERPRDRHRSFFTFLYVDSGPSRFEFRTQTTSRFIRWRLSAYIRDADAETRD